MFCYWPLDHDAPTGLAEIFKFHWPSGLKAYLQVSFPLRYSVLPRSNLKG